jgi:hypothetical protein
LKSEKEGDFALAQDKLFEHLPTVLKVIVLDRDLALMNAIHAVFPLSHHFLCHWHNERCVKACVTSYFSSAATAVSDYEDEAPHTNADDDTDTFLGEWNKVFFAATITQYQLLW